MQECPCCKDYGDVWNVEFLNLDKLKAIMCFECDTVWGLEGENQPQITDYESLTKEKGVVADWNQINKLGQITPTE